ncbi:MAG: hypothetical protein VKO39_05920 [Cyanobacteriota bacterium]|nr:hypothetical protein [Cyanobacteriota bacterium]
MTSSIEDLMRMYSSLCQQWLSLSQSFIAPGQLGMTGADADSASDAAVISRALLQALSAASTSSLSYGYSVQSIIYKHQASLLALNLSQEESRHKRALLIDDVRAFLREIGDTASREGRNFQHQLAVITEELAQAEAKSNHGHTGTTHP